MDRVAHVADIIRDMAAGLELPLRTIEAEWGPGQFEVTFNPLGGLAAADSLLLFRSAVKHLMRRHGLLASFMAKPADTDGREGRFEYRIRVACRKAGVRYEVFRKGPGGRGDIF